MKMYKSIYKLFEMISPKGFLLMLLGAGVISMIIYLMDEQGNMLSLQRIENNMYNIRRESNIQYDANIDLNQFMISQSKIYKPIADHRDIEDAIYYGGAFGIDSDVVEDEEKYTLEDGRSILKVYKKRPLIQFDSKETNQKINTKINAEQAMDRAEGFIKRTSLPNHHQLIKVEETIEKGEYRISFINTIEGIPVYGYNNEVIVNQRGDIIEIRFYEIQYRQKDVLHIISMEDAYEIMVESEGVGVEKKIMVDIQKGELVYRCVPDGESDVEDVTMEPYYRFVGETNEGTSFEKFIPAIRKIHIE